MKQLSRILLFAAFLFCTTFAFAQMTRIGVKGGGNISNVSGDYVNNEKPENYAGWNGGIILDLPFSPRFSFAPEAVYTRRGISDRTNTQVTESGTTTTVDNDLRERFNYIDFPLLAKIKTPSGFNVHFGPYVGLFRNHRVIGTVTTTTDDGTETETTVENIDESTKDGIRKVDYGAVLGIGYTTQRGIGIEVRFNKGLADIHDDGNDTNNSKIPMKDRFTHTFVSAGLHLILGGNYY